MIDLAHYPRRIILIQEDYDGTLHALTTGEKRLSIKMNHKPNYSKVVSAEPYNDPDLETWSDWCHLALMKFHEENNV